MLALPFRLAAQVPADSARPASAATRGHPPGRGARPPGHLRSQRARVGRPGGQRPPHPDPGGHHPPRAAVPARRAVRLRPRRRVRAQPPRAGRVPPGDASTRCGPTPGWWRACSRRTAGAPRPTGDSGAPGGEVAYTIGLVEDNLLGTASSASVAVSQDTRPHAASPSAFAGRGCSPGGGTRGSSTRIAPMDGSARIAVEQPFYSLTSRFGFRVEARGPGRADTPVLRWVERRERYR